jgi:hypothetical protein
MTDFSQDPLTKYLVRFNKNPDKLVKYLSVKVILNILGNVEELKKHIIEKYKTQSTLDYQIIKRYSIEFNFIIEGLKEEYRILALLYYLSDILVQLEINVEFRKAYNFYKDNMCIILYCETLNPFIIQKKYIDFVIDSLCIYHKDYVRTLDHMAFLEEKELNVFYTHIKNTFDIVRRKIYDSFGQRIHCFKEELVANVLHPSRIEKLLDLGISIDDI